MPAPVSELVAAGLLLSGCTLAVPDEAAFRGGLDCPEGLGDCNRSVEDGCEVRLSQSAEHCGVCGASCEEGEICAGGGCVPACHAITLTNDDARLIFPSRGYGVGAGDFTAEIWARVPFGSDHIPVTPLWSMNDDTGTNGFSMSVSRESASCVIYGARGGAGSGSGVVDVDGFRTAAWRHLACQRRGGWIEIWVDGRLDARAPAPARLEEESNVVLGAPRHSRDRPQPYQLDYRVDVGPMRFSRVARMEGPHEPSLRWPVDGDTVAQHLVETGLDESRLRGCGSLGDCTQLLPDEAGGDNPGGPGEGIAALAGTLPCAR